MQYINATVDQVWGIAAPEADRYSTPVPCRILRTIAGADILAVREKPGPARAASQLGHTDQDLQ